MNATQKELLRDALVAALVTMSPMSLPLATLQGTARAAGFRLEDPELLREIEYLVGKGMAELVKTKLSAGLQRWKSTADATDYCEEKGLI
jgi:hypothetical protein